VLILFCCLKLIVFINYNRCVKCFPNFKNCLIIGEKPPRQPTPTFTNKEMAKADSFVPTHGNNYADLLQIKTMEMWIPQAQIKLFSNQRRRHRFEIIINYCLFIFLYLFNLFLNIFRKTYQLKRPCSIFEKKGRAHWYTETVKPDWRLLKPVRFLRTIVWSYSNYFWKG
jgi:hypothetical protein